MKKMLEEYNAVYREMFEDELEDIRLEDLRFGEAGWDSVMSADLMTLFEQTFDIRISKEDKMEFNSYQKGMEILRKYGIDL